MEYYTNMFLTALSEIVINNPLKVSYEAVKYSEMIKPSPLVNELNRQDPLNFLSRLFHFSTGDFQYFPTSPLKFRSHVCAYRCAEE